MPVFLKPLTQPDDAETVELNKLADEQDDPVWRDAWRDWCAGDAAMRLWAGWFNDHIVGAILTRDRCIEGLAVRRVTRGRGVATRMMTLLLEQGDWTVHPEIAEASRSFIRRRFPCPPRDG
ncbi:acetyl-CoA sensor PanZ family protein [Saccharospirillum salsuginis]|uniref:N-acetyltransferase domain-containing protein n=1 Tax=Saccharospirillum salsuginis TaxID=418750 RepID=A0A918K3C2_9GAMM|nr:acetyl-CoA sensor PanZ family protein [Saccharospirillum salsuginis]GGX41299.1 hypothetical protein GCM10007392_05240 [Saccharospirillum salsuginis]